MYPLVIFVFENESGSWTSISFSHLANAFAPMNCTPSSNKTFSNLREKASEEACINVARAIETLQQYTLVGLSRTDYSEIEL